MTDRLPARDTLGPDVDGPFVVGNDLRAEAAQLRRAGLRERAMVVSGPLGERGHPTLGTGASVLVQSVSSVEATAW
jgi:hypothetical protein